jgi:hypothetical protein
MEQAVSASHFVVLDVLAARPRASAMAMALALALALALAMADAGRPGRAG